MMETLTRQTVIFYPISRGFEGLQTELRAGDNTEECDKGVRLR